jgi:hypothetical protein
MSKKRVGIDINEVLRARWLQFDRYYAQEFGTEYEEIPASYTYDFFNTYRWEDTVETVKELHEPDEMPDDINPVHYQVDNEGEADADAFLFKKPEEIKLTAREVYNRFMYQDFLFEIHGSAPIMYRNMDVDVNNFLMKYEDTVNFTVLSVENKFSIPPTLFFLSKIQARFKNYKFVNKPLDMWKHVDVLITTDPEILKMGVPWGKKLVKLNRPYNENIKKGSIEVLQIKDLIEDKKFQKIIKYKNK